MNEVRSEPARIVITGAGVISPIGAGLDGFEQGLYEGRSGVVQSERLKSAAAEIAEFTPQTWLGPKGIRVLDRSARLLCVAGHMALSGANLMQDPASEGDASLGMVVGTIFGSVHSISAFDWSGITEGVQYVNPMEFPNTVINSPAGQAAIRYKLRGVNSTVCAGVASGLHSLAYAADFLRFGRARVLLAGGVEEACEESANGFRKMGIQSPSGTAKPFAEDRDGTVPGEGSALFVMETAETAAARGATPMLEVLGFGNAHDAHSITAHEMHGRGAAEAMRQALESSGIGPDQIACIVASASGSRGGDAMEARALKEVFGERLGGIPVCAPKAALGEAMGVSGTFAAMAAGLALIRQCLPPTAGFTGTDTGLRLSASSAPVQGDYALVNAFGCDGNNAALVIRRWQA